MNIHLVDCDSEDLLFLFDLLTNGGFNVEASSDASEALKRIAKMQPTMVFCEVDMPEIGGLEMLERTKSVSPQTEVVLMARWGGPLRPEDVQQKGGLDLLWKPFGRRDVLRVVERVMHGVR
jgi:DNA-binding NtrC family response regulator